MFPNKVRPLAAIFVAEKAVSLSVNNEMRIIAPVSYFPIIRRTLPEKYEKFNGLEVFHPRYLALPFFHWRWLSYFYQVGIYLKKYVRFCDIINVEWVYPDCYVANKIAHKYGKKVVVVVHGNEAIGYFDAEGHKEKYITALQDADHVVAVSNDLKTKIIENYRISELKITVIPNGIDQNKFFVLPSSEARKRLNLQSPAQKICVCIARLSEEKALHIMIEAIAISQDNLRLNIIGDGPLKHNLKSLIQSLGLSDRVFLIGAIPHNQIFLWLNAADFFCLSSVREGCPVVIHEALACGVPIISTDVGGIPDIVNSEQYGILCPPNNPHLFAEALTRGVSQLWNREKISNYGQNFSWDRVAESMVHVYKKALS